MRTQKLNDPWPINVEIGQWRATVDELIRIAHEIAAAQVDAMLLSRAHGTSPTPCRVLPFAKLQDLLRECMEYFWWDGDSLLPNRDPYPLLNLRILLGPLYRRPRPDPDRRESIKVARGRIIRTRRPIFDEEGLFEDDSLLPSIVDPFAQLRLADPITDCMDMSV